MVDSEKTYLQEFEEVNQLTRNRIRIMLANIYALYNANIERIEPALAHVAISALNTMYSTLSIEYVSPLIIQVKEGVNPVTFVAADQPKEIRENPNAILLLHEENNKDTLTIVKEIIFPTKELANIIEKSILKDIVTMTLAGSVLE